MSEEEYIKLLDKRKEIEILIDEYEKEKKNKNCKESGHMWTWMPTPLEHQEEKSSHACMRCGIYEMYDLNIKVK